MPRKLPLYWVSALKSFPLFGTCPVPRAEKQWKPTCCWPLGAFKTIGWQCEIHGADGTAICWVGYLCASTKFPMSNVFWTTWFPVLTGHVISVGFGPPTDGV